MIVNVSIGAVAGQVAARVVRQARAARRGELVEKACPELVSGCQHLSLKTQITLLYTTPTSNFEPSP